MTAFPSRLRKFTSRWLWLLVLPLLPVGQAEGEAKDGGSRFDKLKEEDRVVFSQRFEKELWPLLTRNADNGCVGCHNSRQNRGDLRFSGQADADFRMLLKKGFLLPDDAGSVLHTVSTKNPRQRMPPGERPPWTSAEIELLRRFVTDLDKKQPK